MLRQLENYIDNKDICEVLIDAMLKKESLSNPPEDGLSPLDYAALAGNLEAIKKLINLGARSKSILYWTVYGATKNPEKAKTILNWMRKQSDFNELFEPTLEEHVNAALGFVNFDKLNMDKELSKPDYHGYTAYHYFAALGLDFIPEALRDKLIPQIDLNFSGPPPYFPDTVATLLAQLGKFARLEEIYAANKKKPHLNLDSFIRSALIYPHYRHKNPPLSFYLAETDNLEVIRLILANLIALDVPLFMDYRYDSNGLTFMHMVFSKNKKLALNLTNENVSPHAKDIQYNLRVNDPTSILHNKTLNDIIKELGITPKILPDTENINSNNENNTPTLCITKEQLAHQQALINALRKNKVDQIQTALAQGAALQTLTPEGYCIHFAAKYGSLEAVQYLATLDMPWVAHGFDTTRHLLIAACHAPVSKRQKMLQWLASDENITKMAAGIMPGHVAAALGNLKASKNSSRCAAGMTEFDYLIFAGLPFVKPEDKEEIIKNIDGKLLEEGFFKRASHFMLLLIQKDIDSLVYAMHNNRNFDINEIYITMNQTLDFKSVFISLLKAGKAKDITQYIRNNPNKINISTVYGDSANKTFLKYLIENRNWDIIELILTQELQKAKEQKCVARHYYVQEKLNEGITIKTSLEQTLILNGQFSMLERLWEIDHDFIQWFQLSSRGTPNGIKERPNTLDLIITDKKGSQTLIRLLDKSIKEEDIDLATDIVKYINQRTLETMTFHHRIDLFEKLIDVLTVLFIKYEFYRHINIDEKPIILEATIRTMLAEQPKLLKKINSYTQTVSLYMQKQLKQTPGDEPSNQNNISPPKIIVTKNNNDNTSVDQQTTMFAPQPFISLDELKKKCEELFKKKFEITHYDENRTAKTATLCFKGEIDDIQALKKAFEKIWKKARPTLSEDSQQCTLTQIPIGLLQNSFLDQPHLIFKNLFEAKIKPEKLTDNYVDLRNMVPENFTDIQLETWKTYLHAAYAYSDAIEIVWDHTEKHFTIQVLQTIWQVSSHIEGKTWHKQKDNYEVDQTFFSEKILKHLSSAIQNVAILKGEYPHFIVKPYRSAPNDNIHGDVYKRMVNHLIKILPPAPQEEPKPTNPSQNNIVETMPEVEDPIITRLKTLKFYDANNTDKLRILFSMITNEIHKFSFITQKTASTAGTQKWKVILPLNGLKGLGGKSDPYDFFRFIKMAINSEFPEFITVDGNKNEMVILLDMPKLGIDAFVSKLGNIKTCYEDQLYLTKLLASDEADNNINNNQNEPLKKPTKEKHNKTIFSQQITESVILRVLQCLKNDTMLSFHLNELAALALQPNRDDNHIYYAYLIHLQVVAVLLSKKQGFVDSIFRALRNLIRHAYLDAEFDRKNIYDLIEPLILAVAKVNEFKGVKVNSLNLFSKQEKLGLGRILNLIRRYENEIIAETLGKEVDKTQHVEAYKQLIANFIVDKQLPDALKKQIILMLCSLIGETEKDRQLPYADVYKILGHKRTDMIEKDFSVFIEEIYSKYGFAIELLHIPCIPSVIL